MQIAGEDGEDRVSSRVSEAACAYRGAARYEDTVTIETRVEAIRSRSVRFAYDLTVDGRRIADGRTTLIAMNADRRPVRIPDEIARALGSTGGT